MISGLFLVIASNMLLILYAIATEPCMRYLIMIGDWLEEKENNRIYRKKRKKKLRGFFRVKCILMEDI